MLTDLSSSRVLLYSKSVDMRKSINGLSIMVSGVLLEDPCSGDIFATSLIKSLCFIGNILFMAVSD